MRVDANLWYLIAFFGFIGILLTAWVVQRIVSMPRLFFAKHIQHAKLFPHISITRLQALAMFFFLLSNILIPSIPIIPFPDWLVIQKRAALACIANVTLLCVGGRGLLFNTLNISRKWLILIHIWVGIVATAEAVLHSMIVVSLKVEQHNYHMMRSGWIAFGLMLGVSFLSIPPSQKLFGSLFIWIHRTLAGGVVGVILWHVLGTTSQSVRILVIFLCGFWILIAVFRLTKILLFSRSGRVASYSYHPDVIKFTVKLKSAVKLYPGCRFYVFNQSHFFRYNFLRSYTALPFYYLPETGRGSVSEITFLVPKHDINTSTFLRLASDQRILIDGPYGKLQDLSCYRNVILAAKGVGLAAILPLALDLATRRAHDHRLRDKQDEIFANQNDIAEKLAASDGVFSEHLSQKKAQFDREEEMLFTTKLHRDEVQKIVMFWSLESNEQMDWAQDQLKILKTLDSQKKILVVVCGYACPRNVEPFNQSKQPFNQSRHWLCLDPDPSLPFDDLVSSKIGEQRRLLPGSFAVATSGNRHFRSLIRRTVLIAMEDMPITFLEAEFQPHGSNIREKPRSGLTTGNMTKPHGIPLSSERASSGNVKNVAKTSSGVLSNKAGYKK